MTDARDDHAGHAAAAASSGTRREGPRRGTSTCTPSGDLSTTSRAGTTSAANTPTSAPWTTGEEVTVLAQVRRVHRAAPMRASAGTLLEVIVGDGCGRELTLTFFNQAWRAAATCARALGPVRRQGHRVPGQAPAQQPGVRPARRGPGADERRPGRRHREIEEFAGALIPVYPATAAVPTWVIARCVRVVLDTAPPCRDPLPATLRAAPQPDRPDRGAAGASTGPSTHRTRWRSPARRLKWDEAFAVQLTLVQRKLRAAAGPAMPRPRRPAACSTPSTPACRTS